MGQGGGRGVNGTSGWAGVSFFRDHSAFCTGQQKAAIMMLAIGEDRAGTLFENLDEEELKELSQAMANGSTELVSRASKKRPS